MSLNDLVVRHERSGMLLTVILGGELDCASVDDISGRVTRLLRPTDTQVLLDLSGVTFCGSAGLTLFIQLHNLVRDRGGELTLYGPSPAVLRSIEMCRLDDVLSIARAVPTVA